MALDTTMVFPFRRQNYAKGFLVNCFRNVAEKTPYIPFINKEKEI